MKSWSMKGIDLKLLSLITSTIALSAVIVTMNHELATLTINNTPLSALILVFVFGVFTGLFSSIKRKSTDNRFFWSNNTGSFSTTVGMILFLITAATAIAALFVMAWSFEGSTGIVTGIIVAAIVIASSLSFFTFYGGVTLLFMTIFLSAQKTESALNHS